MDDVRFAVRAGKLIHLDPDWRVVHGRTATTEEILMYNMIMALKGQPSSAEPFIALEFGKTE